MLKQLSRLIFTAVLFAAGGSIANAHEAYFRDAPSPECSTPTMIATIQERFRTQAFKVHNRPHFRILELSGIHEHRYEDQDVHLGRPIARRYCHATAVFSDHTQRPIWYLIEGGVGLFGQGQSYLGSMKFIREKIHRDGRFVNNVEFCIEGLDPYRVYGGGCRVLH
ncbi:MAG: hypothetical protein AAGI92_01650 [Pseudomonadota bacterium]